MFTHLSRLGFASFLFALTAYTSFRYVLELWGLMEPRTVPTSAQEHELQGPLLPSFGRTHHGVCHVHAVTSALVCLFALLHRVGKVAIGRF